MQTIYTIALITLNSPDILIQGSTQLIYNSRQVDYNLHPGQHLDDCPIVNIGPPYSRMLECRLTLVLDLF